MNVRLLTEDQSAPTGWAERGRMTLAALLATVAAPPATAQAIQTFLYCPGEYVGELTIDGRPQFCRVERA